MGGGGGGVIDDHVCVKVVKWSFGHLTEYPKHLHPLTDKMDESVTKSSGLTTKETSTQHVRV